MKPKIFLSYSWSNTDLIEEIDTDFKNMGIILTRDVRDLGYRKSIKDFMHTVGKHDYVIMLISDEYMRSENCMYEVTELLNTHEFKDRILPIVHDNARQIFESMGSAIYLDYWKIKKQEAHKYNRKHANQVSVDALKKITRIQNEIDDFFISLKDLNTHSLAYLKLENYSPLLQIIGIENEVEQIHWERINDSDKISDFENYLIVYQNGNHTDEANAKILALKNIEEKKLLVNVNEKLSIVNSVGEGAEISFPGLNLGEKLSEQANQKNSKSAFKKHPLIWGIIIAIITIIAIYIALLKSGAFYGKSTPGDIDTTAKADSVKMDSARMSPTVKHR